MAHEIEKVTTGKIYTRLKNRLYNKLGEEPYVDEMGNYVDPLPAKDLAAIGNFVLKMLAYEEVKAVKENSEEKVAVIPSMPIKANND